MRKRDLFDYIVLGAGLISTAFTIYFFIERYKAIQTKKRNPSIDTDPDKSKVGVIID